MGCGASKEQIDFGKIEEEKARQNALAKKPVIEHSASLLEPATGFHAVDFVRASKAPLQHFMSQPKLVSQVKESAIAIINTNPNKGAHHLKNVFAAPLEDLGNFQAPVFLKVREEKVFIREALKNNFVFAALSQRELRTIIDAFERMEVHGGETLIQQGDAGDYFYIIREGKVRFDVGGNTVGRAFKGKSFGELALLYTSPRAASVIAESDTVLYRVDQKTFRYIMQSQTLQTENDKKDLLLGVAFLKTLEPSDINKLIHTMTPRKFAQGEYLCTKGEQGDVFYVIQEGKIRVTEITIGSTDYENQTIGPGDYFGERALVTKEPRSANCIGETEGIALCIDLETFEKVLGNLSVLTMKSEDKRKLVSIWSEMDGQASLHLTPLALSPSLGCYQNDSRFPFVPTFFSCACFSDSRSDVRSEECYYGGGRANECIPLPRSQWKGGNQE
jgi:cAMP-dependent protein kinase regulator